MGETKECLLGGKRSDEILSGGQVSDWGNCPDLCFRNSLLWQFQAQPPSAANATPPTFEDCSGSRNGGQPPDEYDCRSFFASAILECILVCPPSPRLLHLASTHQTSFHPHFPSAAFSYSLQAVVFSLFVSTLSLLPLDS